MNFLVRDVVVAGRWPEDSVTLLDYGVVVQMGEYYYVYEER